MYHVYNFFDFFFFYVQCNRTNALDGLYAHLLHTPSKRSSTLRIVDASCSVAVEPAVLISQYYHIPYVSLFAHAL